MMIDSGLGNELCNWNELDGDWPTLLIGNGMSINMWPNFSYPELLLRSDLNGPAGRLFDDLETSNFEVVLEALWHAERVLLSVNRSPDEASHLYEHVRSELIAAIRRVHVEWTRVDLQSFVHVADQLANHDLVFTMNYDLLTYWAVMAAGVSASIRDFFWNPGFSFDIANSALRPHSTGLIYLHGGIHLWQDVITGLTGKWTAIDDNLLATLESALSSGGFRQPLFVTEGTWQQKMRVIRRSEYLTFARHMLVTDESDLVIFGASLGTQDDHIVEAINSGSRRRIAISIYPQADEVNIATMAHYRAKFPRMNLEFFDSQTHPLGDRSLRVSP